MKANPKKSQFTIPGKKSRSNAALKVNATTIREWEVSSLILTTDKSLNIWETFQLPLSNSK